MFQKSKYFLKKTNLTTLLPKIGFVFVQALTSSEYLLSVKSLHFLGIFLNLNSPTPLFTCTWNILPVHHRNDPVLSSDVDANDCYREKRSDSLDLDSIEVLMFWHVGLGVDATNLGHPLLSQV
jgi:hypothetical protein